MALVVVLNGQERMLEIGQAASLTEVVAALGLKPDRVAVEHNGEIARRSAWEGIEVRNGDKLEVVHFVGGGSPTLIKTSWRLH